MSKVVLYATLGVAVWFVAAAQAAEQEKVWKGTWKNRKFNTTGPLQCTAVSKDGKTWEAKFKGTFKGDPFEYPATFDAVKKGAAQNLSGTAQLDGDRYQWTGSIKGKRLEGRFRSLKGNNGEFVLEEVKPN
ncbi:MAG: hypothetical protein ACRC1K_22390 [Planctomycetia bacterium]